MKAEWMKAYCANEYAPYKPPAHVIRRLYYLADGRLRLRWSREREQWAVEIRTHRPIHTSLVTPRAHYKLGVGGYVVERDMWICQRDGYSILGYWDAQPPLGDWCIHSLQLNDMRRLGGAERVNQMLLDQEAKQATAQNRANSNDNQAFFAEFYRDEQRRQGEVGFVPRTATGL